MEKEEDEELYGRYKDGRYKDGKHFMEDIKKQAVIFAETERKISEERDDQK